VEPAQLPRDDLGVDPVFECSGVFREKGDLEKHIQAGASTAILSAPAKGDGMPTVVRGVSKPHGDEKQISSCASRTTNCIAPVVEAMTRRIAVHKAIMIPLAHL
jgi:glyceraldehyde 3-phosphate dehydrogenase